MKHFIVGLILLIFGMGACLAEALPADGENKAPEVFRVVYFDNYAPFSWKGSDGQMQGVFVDLLNFVLSEELGIAVSHHGYPWRRAQLLVKNGQADAFVAPITAERLSFAAVSQQPLLLSRFVLFTRAQHPQISHFSAAESLRDLVEYRFITQLGDGWAQQNLSDMRVEYVDKLDTVLRMLAQGRDDLFVESALVGHYNIGRLDLREQVVEVPEQVVETSPYHLFLGKRSGYYSRQLLERFDNKMTALSASQNQKLKRLIEAYR